MLLLQIIHDFCFYNFIGNEEFEPWTMDIFIRNIRTLDKLFEKFVCH